jgi:hypothetical protein
LTTIVRTFEVIRCGVIVVREMNAAEIAQTLAAMSKVEPFDMTDEERAAADAWEKKVNDYGIANMEKGIEDVFR